MRCRAAKHAASRRCGAAPGSDRSTFLSNNSLLGSYISLPEVFVRPVRVARRGATASSPVAGYLLIVRDAHAHTDLIGANTDRGGNFNGSKVV